MVRLDHLPTRQLRQQGGEFGVAEGGRTVGAGDAGFLRESHGIAASRDPSIMARSAFCAHTIASDETLVVPDARQDPRFCTNPLVVQDPKICFYAGAPLQSSNGHNLGTLCVIDRLPRHFSGNQVRLLEDLAQLVSRELELRRQAIVHPISGFVQRSSFLEQAEPELGRARLSGQPLALLALQIDHFSQVRHRWGQATSDQALRDVAAFLNSQLLPQDLIGQIGDQDFALLMVNVDLEPAMERAEAIRCGISELPGVFRSSGYRLEISGGLTLLAPDDQHAADLLLRAERALFLAQGNGHNQIADLLL
ncbi:diguanylate cyclase [Cyanobium sp. Aljojuca 7D2]|uniref:sensor domain-containing diguanylate cyclase n=1 Tax=Cyanobium sp. Aljojuca 7D2 TaxID=2823698 RepID=UPI0020CC4634|nr:diguanylate cyclase [Cyanobium sp. Aljojuca 7D2]MCP9889644.1 diguanylate cyclase [Cyanobium sp. Aljojuca 7D2]